MTLPMRQFVIAQDQGRGSMASSVMALQGAVKFAFAYVMLSNVAQYCRAGQGLALPCKQQTNAQVPKRQKRVLLDRKVAAWVKGY